MGTIISTAANSFGDVLGNAFVAPFKSIFGGSCEELCAGPWDLICFIEHLCVANLVKLLMISGLSYITLLFLYLLFKLGICQCIGRSLCKMCWVACETYWRALAHISCFLWYKIKNTKRIYRHRRRQRRQCFQDLEVGRSSSDESGFSSGHLSASRKRKLHRERREDPSTLYGSHGHRHGHHHHTHVKLKSRRLSLSPWRGSQRLRSLRYHQLSKRRHAGKGSVSSKRQRVR